MNPSEAEGVAQLLKQYQRVRVPAMDPHAFNEAVRPFLPPRSEVVLGEKDENGYCMAKLIRT
jgi:hypothetical protein